MAILQDIGAFSNPFGPPSQGEWNLSRGIFSTTDKFGQSQEIVFFYEKLDAAEVKGGYKTAIENVQDRGGRRLAVYKYPYLDGQGVADLGREGEDYSFNIKFHGNNYQDKLNEFLQKVINNGKPGVLVHPVRSGTKTGAINARFKDYEFLHRHDEFNAVTIRAVFIEDNTGSIQGLNRKAVSQDSALRTALQTLTSVQATVSQAISNVSALLLLPASIVSAMTQRLNSITGQVSRLFGQLASTFSTNSQVQSLAAQSQNIATGIPGLNSGSVNAGSVLPPVFQNGFDPTTQTSIDAQISSYVNASQITTQQAMFLANQARTAVAAAIEEVNNNFGNYGYEIMVQYRILAVQIQEATQSSISSAQNQTVLYTVPYSMSLRMVARLNNLGPDDANSIESLNPYLPSVNLIPKGSVILVPAAA